MAKKRKFTSKKVETPNKYNAGDILYFDRTKFDKIVLGALTEVDGVKGRIVYTGGDKIKFEVE